MPTAITLNPDQERVAKQIHDWLKENSSRFLTIGGFAGTGKTTLIAQLRLQLAKDYKKVAFCCFTGKAASVLRQKLQEAGALKNEDTCSTIHSLIYKPVLDPDGQITNWDRTASLLFDLIIIDEGSMLNQTIWHDLLSYNLPILVFGDHGQLPPIEGSFNLMQQPQLVLEQIVRQAADNPIIHLSKQIREGRPLPFGKQGTVHKYSLSDPESGEIFEELFKGSSEDYLCLCGYNRTRTKLNREIRHFKEYSTESPTRGDRVICLKNNYSKMIFNGMLGKIEEIKEEPDHWYQATIAMEDRKGNFEGSILKSQFNAPKTIREGVVGITEREYGDLFDFGYALTVHKAQGSEAKRVILFEERMFSADRELWQRWLYTAVTRAKEELYIFA